MNTQQAQQAVQSIIQNLEVATDKSKYQKKLLRQYYIIIHANNKIKEYTQLIQNGVENPSKLKLGIKTYQNNIKLAEERIEHINKLTIKK